MVWDRALGGRAPGSPPVQLPSSVRARSASMMIFLNVFVYMCVYSSTYEYETITIETASSDVMALRRALLLSLAIVSLAFDFDDEDETAVETANPAFFSEDGSGASCTLEHRFGGEAASTRSKLFYQNFAAAIAANGGKASARVSQGGRGTRGAPT